MPRRPRPGAAAAEKLSGCALTAIIGGGLLLVLVPVMAILAAIALPAYNDYTVRAKVATAVNALQPLTAGAALRRRRRPLPRCQRCRFPGAG